LDIINDEHNVPAAANIFHTLQPAKTSSINATFTLDGFKNNCRRKGNTAAAVFQESLKIFKGFVIFHIIVKRHGNTVMQRSACTVALKGIARNGKRANGHTVKSIRK